ncbi:MAG: SCO family protein [Proteobacteria bacterium]|nr:SCO family protein [Pseudomonadota bacterium]
MNRRAMTMRLPLLPPLLPLAALLLALPACAPPAEAPPLAGAAIGGPFTLADKAGKAVRWDDFRGRYRIVYFGYSFCPDACPTDVGVMMRGFTLFERAHPDRAAQVQPIFITIDPARDTQAVVGQFAAAFSPRLLGLTGSAPQVDQAAKAFGAFYARGKATPGGYLMEHSRIAYLMGKGGEPIAMLPVDKGPAQGPQAVADELAKWVK